jgi:hypothetical protein
VSFLYLSNVVANLNSVEVKNAKNGSDEMRTATNICPILSIMSAKDMVT